MTLGFPRPRILIVDDSPNEIAILNEVLKGDYEVMFATNGEDALRIVNSEVSPDLILLDIVMPGMDGYEICERIKSLDLGRTIPVIFVTVKSDEDFETRGFELGAVDYVTKPFSLPVVKARVKTHLELKRQRDVLEDLSSVDGLTGVANRRRFDHVLNLEWRRALRNGSLVSLVMVDIDFFKPYNDRYGHMAGDDCLKRVAIELQGALSRAEDFLARYGGEEFAVILPGTDCHGASVVAERLRARVAEVNIRHEHSQAADRVTVSVGTATGSPSCTDTPSELLEAADKMLYEAKVTGRNRCRSVDLRSGSHHSLPGDGTCRSESLS
ncbi:MAG: PleD family two-component system response regulator [Thermodesulfobacteriota bacterium]